MEAAFVLVLLLVALVMISIVVATVHQARRSRSGGAMAPAELQDRVRDLCAQGRPVEAIKVLRQHTPGLGLRQARAAVEAVQAGRPLEQALADAGHRAPAVHALPDDLRAHLWLLSARGKKIHAIRELRQLYPAMPLKQAKDLVDALAAGPHPYPAQNPSRNVIKAADGHDLADRVRALKADGRTEQAVHLVRGETGMGHAESLSFVEAIQPERDAL